MNPGNIPRFDQTAVNLPVLAIAAAVTLFSGVLFSLAPALATLSPELSELLRSGNKPIASGSNRIRYCLVASEVALLFVLLAGAMLLIRSYIKLDAQNPGFTRSTLTMQLALDAKYSECRNKRSRFL